MGYLKVSSWNMQGGGKEKIAYIQPDCDNVIQFCQESGVPGSTGFVCDKSYEGYICVASEVDPSAMNQRCTTSCLVSQNILNNYSLELEGFESELHRPVVGCSIKNTDISFYAFHATANDEISVSEVKGIIKKLNENGGYAKKWVLLGDFNSAPWRYDCDNREIYAEEKNLIRISSTGDRADNEDYCYLWYSAEPTQGANGSRTNYLDYVFMSLGMKESGMVCDGFENETVYEDDDDDNVLSDHNRITVCFNI